MATTMKTSNVTAVQSRLMDTFEETLVENETLLRAVFRVFFWGGIG
jgi:hypothetical protein